MYQFRMAGVFIGVAYIKTVPTRYPAPNIFHGILELSYQTVKYMLKPKYRDFYFQVLEAHHFFTQNSSMVSMVHDNLSDFSMAEAIHTAGTDKRVKFSPVVRRLYVSALYKIPKRVRASLSFHALFPRTVIYNLIFYTSFTIIPRILNKKLLLDSAIYLMVFKLFICNLIRHFNIKLPDVKPFNNPGDILASQDYRFVTFSAMYSSFLSSSQVHSLRKASELTDFVDQHFDLFQERVALLVPSAAGAVLWHDHCDFDMFVDYDWPLDIHIAYNEGVQPKLQRVNSALTSVMLTEGRRRLGLVPQLEQRPQCPSQPPPPQHVEMAQLLRAFQGIAVLHLLAIAPCCLESLVRWTGNRQITIS